MPVDIQNPRNETERRIASLAATHRDIADTVAESRRLIEESRRVLERLPPGRPEPATPDQRSAMFRVIQRALAP